MENYVSLKVPLRIKDALDNFLCGRNIKKECDDDADNDDIAATNITFLFTFHKKVFYVIK